MQQNKNKNLEMMERLKQQAVVGTQQYTPLTVNELPDVATVHIFSP
jgi:hypothetical protein